jgi:microcystin-dependent protein
MPKINLLNILPGDSQTILIDKVNYNFDQILTAGGGPQGSQGIRGATGPIGPQGIQGPTGPQGLRGARWYVQPVAPSSLNVGSYPTPWGEPELGDYWLAGETGANPYGVYVYNDLGGGTLGWDYSGVYINTQSAFSAVDDINLTTGERVLLHNTQFSHTYGLLLSDYGASGGAPGYNYSNLGQFGLNSERAKLKIATDPSSAMATLLSFGRADQDAINYSSPSYSQGKNPRFLWTAASGYNLDFTNPGGDFNIKTPGNNFNVPLSVNISLIASSNIQANGLNVSITRAGSSNSFNNYGTGAYYAEGSVMRYNPNYGLASGNFIVGDTVSTSGTKGLVISSSSTSSGRALVLKAAVTTNNSVYGRIVAEGQSSSIAAAGISFAIDGSTAADSRIDFATSSSSGGYDVTRLRLDRIGNLQFRFGSITGSDRDALIYIQESAGTDVGANVSVKGGSSQGGSYGGGSLYLAGGTGGSVSGKSGNVVISSGFVPAAGSAMGGSIYIHPPLANKTNVTGVAIGLAESASVDAALVVKDTSDGIAGGDVLQLKKANDTTFFGFDSDGYLTKGVPFTSVSNLSSVLSSDANNLDYYDEGDWSGTLELVPRVTQSGWNSSKYKIVKSKYTRIGDTVQVDFVVKIDSLTSGVTPPTTASDGYLYIKGFPYGADFSNVRLGTATNSYSAPALPYVSIKGMGLGNAGNPIGANPVGTIQSYPSLTPPSGWVNCNGGSLSINSYRDLYNALGGSSSPYGSNDGFSSTFKVPDLSGKFIRGVGGNADSLGNTQSDDIKSHTHTITWQKGQADMNEAGTYGELYDARTPHNRTTTTSSTGGTETRPINMAMNYIIYTGGGSVGISDLSGAFVNESSESRLYLYNGIGNLSVSSIPGGSGVVSYLHGNFSYFTTSSTKYSGTPAPSPSPTPTPTPPTPPTPTPSPASACDSAPSIDTITSIGGGQISIAFTLANSGTNATSVTLESSTDNSTWTPSTAGTTSPITITEPIVTTYYRLKTNCSGSPATSSYSSTDTYVVSAPPSSTRTGNIIVNLAGDKFRVNLDQPATCTYTFSLTGTWLDWDTSASGNWSSAPFQINAGSSVSSPIWVDCINNNFPYTDLNSLAGGSPNYNTIVTGGTTSSQCSGTVTLVLTP